MVERWGLEAPNEGAVSLLARLGPGLLRPTAERVGAQAGCRAAPCPAALDTGNKTVGVSCARNMKSGKLVEDSPNGERP